MIFMKGSFTMRFRFIHIVAALTFFSVVGPHAHAVDIYVLSGSTQIGVNTATGFGKIDSATGVYTQISASLSGGHIVNNPAWSASKSAFYVTEDIGSNTTLRTLSTSGALSSSIGTIGMDIYGMAYRPTDSTLYAFNLFYDHNSTIDPNTGVLTDFGVASGISGYYNAGRYAIHNDKINVIANDRFVGRFGTIGFTASTPFSQIGTTNDLYKYMDPVSDGTTLYGVYGDGTAGNQKLYSVNPSDGSLTFMTNISGSGLGIYFFGAGIVTGVPEPSTYALATIAMGVIACAARRRNTGRKA